MPDKPVFIFDLGKVLIDFDYSIADAKIRARSTRPPAEPSLFAGFFDLMVAYETGLITRDRFFGGIRDAIGFQGSPAEFGDYFAKIFAPITPMIELNAALRRAGYRTYIFSNTNDLAIEHVRQDFPFFQDFDGYILSYEIKAMKPQPAIYEAMEHLCGLRGSDLIYLDDRAENIAAGAARGWRTILHENPEKTLAELPGHGIRL